MPLVRRELAVRAADGDELAGEGAGVGRGRRLAVATRARTSSSWLRGEAPSGGRCPRPRGPWLKLSRW